MRRAAELVKAHAAGNTLAVQAALARKAELPGMTIALVLAIRTRLNPLLDPVMQMEQAADEMERAERRRGR